MKTDLKKNSYKWDIVWLNVVHLTVLHVGALYGLYLCLAGHVMWQTLLFTYVLKELAIIGITAGAHRLWSHRSYTANLPLRILLAAHNTLAYQAPIWVWARDHRVHHKWSETDADPYNSRRGYFFSHIGWLMIRKHPDVTQAGSKLDFSDLLADPVVRLQRDYYLPLVAVIGFILPTATAVYGWGESAWTAYWVAGVLRHTVIQHVTWLVNSAAHLWPTGGNSLTTGSKPYDARISPVEFLPVSLLTCGEGWHNFHHAFPRDYRAAEMGTAGLSLLGCFLNFNPTVAFIDFFAWLGWASDCRKTSDALIASYKEKYGEKLID